MNINTCRSKIIVIKCFSIFIKYFDD